jgi:hypothetical protein
LSTPNDRIARVKWNLAHLFDRKSVNPYVAAGEDDLKPKQRTGWEDLFHSIKNLWAHTPKKDR